MVLCALRRVLARHFNTRSWLQACWQSWEHAAVSAGWCGESSAVAQVVITGSSKGLGYAMAQQFLALGDDVVSTPAARRTLCALQTACACGTPSAGCCLTKATCATLVSCDACNHLAACCLSQAPCGVQVRPTHAWPLRACTVDVRLRRAGRVGAAP